MRRQLLIPCLILLLCSLAVVPFLHRETPCSNDGGLHFFRVAAMRRSLEHGVFFSRWLSDVAFGYGIPFFNYRAPLSYYSVLAIHMAGLPLPLAQNLVYALTFAVGALGMYLLVRDLLGVQAAIVAAVAYAYAPYRFVDTIVLAIQPEAYAIALLPLVLWSFRRLAIEGGRRWFLASTGLLTTLYLSHNISSLLFTPLLIAYVAVLWWVYRDRGLWGQTALAFSLSVGLTTYFWLPALAEKDYVQLYLSHATRHADFHHNFLSLKEILASPNPVDTSLMNPPLQVTLGVVQALLAGLGFVIGVLQTSWGERNERQATLLFFAAVALLLTFMSTPASVWLWENVPLLRFVQFPWRLVGRATLPVAVLTGATMLPLAQPMRRGTSRASRLKPQLSNVLLPMLIGLLILTSLPSTYPPRGYCPMADYPTVQDVHQYEHRTKLVGVDPEGSYFPVWVERRPTQSPLEDQYGSDGSIQRFDHAALPRGARLVDVDYGPNRARVVLESPEAFQARYLAFYFPGWRVKVDGERVPISPSDPQGLITFEVPSGRHVVHVRFGETPLRLGADVVSVLALLALTASMVLVVKPEASPSPRELQPGSLKSAGLLFTAVSLLVLKFAVLDQLSTPLRQSRLEADGSLPGVEHSVQQPYADGLRLIGYDQSTGEIPADKMLRVDLYWTVRSRPSHRYQSVIHLVGPQGLRWSLKDSHRPTDFRGAPPTTAWDPGRYAMDSHEIEPLPGTPPGRYDIVLTVFHRETLQPLSVVNEAGQPVAPELVLGQMTLNAPRRQPELEDLDIQHPVNQRLGALTLLGVNVSRDEAAPGDPVLVTTFWRAGQKPILELTVHLELRAPDSSVAADYWFSPTAPWHPTTAWRTEDIWRGQHQLHLPADLETASYTWSLGLSPSPSQRSVSLPQFLVTAPDRVFTRPPLDIETHARVGDIATLVGVTVEPGTSDLKPGTALSITLVWQVEDETQISYRVFVHLVGPDGALVAQSDSVPGEWTRPTTGWLSGEYVMDAHTITIPADAQEGTYSLKAGLYDPEGRRLTLPDGSDAVAVTSITIESAD